MTQHPSLAATAAWASLALILPCSLPTAAQCVGGDGFDSAPCCSAITPNLAAFPPIALSAQGVCWTACSPPTSSCLNVFASPPAPLSQCGEFGAQLTVTDCSGLALLSGFMTLVYTRTWNETAASGTTLQVSRLHAKVDLQQVTSAPPSCNVPACAVAGAPAFYYGYVDYAFECGTILAESSLVLFHNCDDMIHNAAYSAVPGVFHPGETRAIVAPDTSVNPFVPSIAPPPAFGVPTGEAMRSLVSASPPLCRAEEPVVGGIWLPLASGCLCPLSLAPGQNSAVQHTGTAACGSNFNTLNFWPFVPWFHAMTSSIGTWTTNASYPGPERVSVSEGLYRYREACDPPGMQWVDVMYGSITEGGYPMDPAMVPAPNQTLIDMVSNYSSVLPGPVLLPLVGLVRSSQHLIYENL